MSSWLRTPIQQVKLKKDWKVCQQQLLMGEKQSSFLIQQISRPGNPNPYIQSRILYLLLLSKPSQQLTRGIKLHP